MNIDNRPDVTTQAGGFGEPWWKGAAIYQIYPRSFMDSNGDGIGDLPGITARLDHVARLGMDAIWISPFFTSPQLDFGYDVSDYCDVDPIFGKLDDFDKLVVRAHELGLRVLIDQIYSHTSDQHPWFQESRASRDNPKSDWYVWADPKPEGSPPSNWQSVFGGPAWRWDARRQQYYLHNFLSSQPQLNGHNRAVQDALLEVTRFWLDRGVDGFRLDALNFFMHDPQLRDNPPATTPGKRSRPYDFQRRIHNQSHPDIPLFLERIRRVTDEYGAVFTVAEVGGRESIGEMKAFTSGDRRLNSAYGFDFLYAGELTPDLVCAAAGKWPGEPGEGWPSWAFENHDAPRALSRWCRAEHREELARLKIALLTALRGNIILYQGEELGLTQVEIAFEQLRDPEAIANWPLTLSRDGARTPMPWCRDAADAGFGAAEPWLPVGDENKARAVDAQEADNNSLLAFTRQMLSLRRSEPILLYGAAKCHGEGALLRIDRIWEGKTITCLFNTSAAPLTLPPLHQVNGTVLARVNGAEREVLPPFGALMVAA